MFATYDLPIEWFLSPFPSDGNAVAGEWGNEGFSWGRSR